MKMILRTAAAVLLGYVLVVLITEFGFRLFPGGRAPKHAGVAATSLATLVAITAGFIGGYAAGALGRIRPRYAAMLVATPLVAESIWLLTTRTPPEEFWFDLVGSVTLIASTIAGGVAAEILRLRSHRLSSRA